MSDSLTTTEMFERLRHDEAHHLGMGDIRLTIGQQEWIEAREHNLEARIAELEIFRYAEDVTRDSIKAEGIRKMVAKTKKDYYNPVTETTTDLIEMSEALGYADKLERG